MSRRGRVPSLDKDTAIGTGKLVGTEEELHFRQVWSGERMGIRRLAIPLCLGAISGLVSTSFNRTGFKQNESLECANPTLLSSDAPVPCEDKIAQGNHY